jgi:hypothetical protein
MLPSGEMRAVRDPMGMSTVYEDQLSSVYNIVSKCKTRDEANIAIFDGGRGHDPHHSIHARVIRAQQVRSLKK